MEERDRKSDRSNNDRWKRYYITSSSKEVRNATVERATINFSTKGVIK